MRRDAGAGLVRPVLERRGTQQQVLVAHGRLRSTRLGDRVKAQEILIPLDRGLINRLAAVAALVERPDSVVDAIDDRLPVVLPRDARRSERGLQRVGVDSDGSLVETIRPDRARERLRDMARDEPRERLWLVALRVLHRRHVRRERWRELVACDMSTPEIGDRFDHDGIVVGSDLRIEREAGGECGVTERALAEAVDGKDRRFVERLQRKIEQVGELLPGAVGLRDQAVDQLRDEVIGGGSDRRCLSLCLHVPLHVCERLRDSRANALS